MRRRAPRPLADALSVLGRELAPQTPLANAQAAWEKAVGAAAAAHCQPAFERSGTLMVDCEQAVWAQEMNMRSVEVLESLNAALGPGSELAAVRFRVR
jgi:predicted nucleic acid-binding Zn ribbon protein